MSLWVYKFVSSDILTQLAKRIRLKGWKEGNEGRMLEGVASIDLYFIRDLKPEWNMYEYSIYSSRCWYIYIYEE